MAKKDKKQKVKKPEPKQKEKTKPKRKRGARKKFFEAKIPLTATKVHLYGYSPEELENNIVKLDLSKTLRGKNMELKAKIKYKNEKLTGELQSIKLLPIYIKKVMRRGVDYVEDSFIIECKDAKIQVKPFMITRKRVSRSVRKAIRNNARKFLETKIKTRSYEDLFSEITTGKLQKELSLKVKKTYPLALCEIRTLEILGPIEKKTKKPESNKEELPEEKTNEESPIKKEETQKEDKKESDE
jgi:ribosomal protein S3AE